MGVSMQCVGKTHRFFHDPRFIFCGHRQLNISMGLGMGLSG